MSGDSHPELPDDPDLGARPVHLQPSVLALVGVGGAAGTGCRSALSAVIPVVGRWPTDIFVINLVGAFVLGWLVETLASRGPDEGRRRSLRLLLGTGFCGGFTTYSALAVDTEQLLRHGPTRARSGLRARHRGHRLRPQLARRAGGRTPAADRPVTLVLSVLVVLAGGLGAVARFVLDGVVRDRTGGRFPYGTVLVNLSGSLLLGFLTGLVAAHLVPEDLRLIIGTGLLGGYTTFSTASFESLRLAQERRPVAALLNGLGTLVAGVALAGLGLVLGLAL